MKRVICLAVVILFGLTCTSPALARMDLRKKPIETRSRALDLVGAVALPVTLFVTISQKPVMVAATSVQSILRQILLGQKKTHGMPLGARVAGI